MTVYLIHFKAPIGDQEPPAGRKMQQATHYLGSASDVIRRMAEHAAGRGARLLAVARERNVPWELVRCWDGGRLAERRLKRWKKARLLCPICTPRLRRRRARRRFSFEPEAMAC